MRNKLFNKGKDSLSNLMIYFSVTAYALGQGMIIPAIPLYAHSLQATETTLGIIGTLPAVSYAVLAAKFGELSEKRGRRIFIIIGSLIYSLVSYAYLISSNLNQILVIRFLEGISLALFWPCVEAYIADLFDSTSRQHTVGYYSLAWSSGTTLGPAVGGFLISRISMKSPFVVCTIMMLVSLFITLLFTGRVPDQRKHSQDRLGRGSTPLRSIRYAILGYAFAQATVLSLYPVHGSIIGYTEFEIGMLLSLVGLARTFVFGIYTFWETPSGSGMTIKGYLILTVSLVFIPLLSWIYASAINFAMMGIGLGLVYVSIISLAMNHQERGTATGVFESGIGIGGIAGPFVSGIAAEHIGILGPYWLSGSLVAVLAATTRRLLRRRQGKPLQ
jgi:MFS family permease